MNLVLFDMDGTLTEPRKKIKFSMISAIKELSKHTKVGIVTGSGYDYLIHQCSDMWSSIGGVNPENLYLMPCNGTQLYKWRYTKWTKEFSKNIRDEIGSKNVDNIISELIRLQSDYMVQNPPHSFTGHFVSYRDSLINWSPVGRNANSDQRNDFIIYDLNGMIRANLNSKLQKAIESLSIKSNISSALGGSTSIDIYPKGWDKTFCLGHFKDTEFWFVGDKCWGDGNDRLIYEEILKTGKAYETTSPEETIKIIKAITKRIKESNNEIRKT